jgi:hypothetical protein
MALTTKESRLPELRLPEISRDSIARGLSEMRAPDFSKMERPNIEMPDIDLSKVDFPRIDVGKAVTDAAVAVGLVRPSRRRWPYLLGAAVIAGLTAWALMHSTAVRDRLDRAARSARERMDEMREDEELELDPVAFTAAETHPIEDGAFADVAGALDDAGVNANDYPEGLGVTTDLMAAAEDGTVAFEAAKNRS